MTTIFEAKKDSVPQISFEELANQTGRVLPNREELVVMDYGYMHGGYPYLNGNSLNDGYGGNHYAGNYGGNNYGGNYGNYPGSYGYATYGNNPSYGGYGGYPSYGGGHGPDPYYSYNYNYSSYTRYDPDCFYPTRWDDDWRLDKHHDYNDDDNGHNRRGGRWS